MHIHCADIAAVFISPNGIQQHFPGVDPVGIEHKKLDHIEFFRGKVRKLAVAVGIAPIQVQADGSNRQHVAFLPRTGTAAPEQGLYSGF